MAIERVEKGKIYATLAGVDNDRPTLYVGIDDDEVMTDNPAGWIETAKIRPGADLGGWVELNQDAVAAAVLEGKI